MTGDLRHKLRHICELVGLVPGAAGAPGLPAHVRRLAHAVGLGPAEAGRRLGTGDQAVHL